LTTVFSRAQWLSKLYEEGSFYLTIPAVQQFNDLALAVPPVGIESKQAAVLATDVAGEALQLPPVVVPDGAIAAYELVDGGN
jgi:hypothetical protein